MKIAYNILVNDEQECLINLLSQLKKYLINGDEIFCLLDSTNLNKKSEEIVKSYTNNIFYRNLNNNFAEQRNYLIDNTNEFWKEKEFVGVEEKI